MAKYFEYFPKVAYNVEKTRYGDYELGTNIMFRLRIIRSVLANSGSYYSYTVRDGDTPENLADKIYNDPEAHWVILYANDMIDPQYDWPLSYRDFNAYIKDKYGTVEWAKTNYHHYEKVIERKHFSSDLTTTWKVKVDDDKLTTNELTVPYDTWTNLTDTQAVDTYEVSGDTVQQTVYRNEVTYYDWEMELNEKKRDIRIIKAQYWPQIRAEFQGLTQTVSPFRRVIR